MTKTLKMRTERQQKMLQELSKLTPALKKVNERTKALEEEVATR